MKLDDLRPKKVSDILDLIVDKFPSDEATVGVDTTLSKAASSIAKSPYKMVVAVDQNNKVIGVCTDFDIAKTLKRKSIRQSDPIKTVLNRKFVGVDVSDTVSDLESLLSKTPVDKVVVTDQGKYVGFIDRQKLADRFDLLLS